MMRGLGLMPLLLTGLVSSAIAETSNEAAVRKMVANESPSYQAQRSFDGKPAGAAQQVAPLQISAERADQLLGNLKKHYQISYGAPTTIAGRPAIAVTFVPTDGWRYKQALWLDSAYGVVLKSEHWRGEQRLGVMEINRIEFATQTPASASTYAESQAGFSVRSLPDGFVLRAVKVEPKRAQQIYSDGLAQISVFVQSTGQLPGYGELNRGATTMISKRNSGVDFIAVGEVPAPALERILSSIDSVQ
jgi:negative regulator of sigma E activity